MPNGNVSEIEVAELEKLADEARQAPAGSTAREAFAVYAVALLPYLLIEYRAFRKEHYAALPPRTETDG